MTKKQKGWRHWLYNRKACHLTGQYGRTRAWRHAMFGRRIKWFTKRSTGER